MHVALLAPTELREDMLKAEADITDDVPNETVAEAKGRSRGLFATMATR